MTQLNTPIPTDNKEAEFEKLKQSIHSKLVDKLDLSARGRTAGRRPPSRDPTGRRASLRYREYLSQPQRNATA